jgi:hypothetical protein
MKNNREQAPFPVREFLWNLAGFKKSIIRNCQVDEYHVTIIGSLLLLVGIYAMLAWTFFFQTVTDNLFVAVTGGLFMGAFIVAFDRALIASLATGRANPLSLGFRLTLAMLLGVFLAQPMILKFYEPEVKREAQIIMDQKILERKEELRQIYAGEMNSLQERQTSLERQLADKEAVLLKAEEDFKVEMDGSGGTGRWGYSTVAKQKERVLARHQQEYEAMKAAADPELAELREETRAIETRITEDIDTYTLENDRFGTLILAEALKSLVDKDESNTLRNRILLLTIILTMIELSALIAKLLFRTRSYHSAARLLYEEEVRVSEVDKEVVLGKLNTYKEEALENELRMIREFFDRSRPVNDDKLDGLMEEWNASADGKYKEYWKRFKETLTIGN